MSHRKLICSVFLLLLLVSSMAHADIGEDKYKHASGCAAISTLSTVAISQLWPDMPPWKRALMAVGASLAVGIAKEAYDATGHGTAEWGDLGADTIGATVGVSFTFTW
jgi:uncharacterized protein YfiM (DUF2279 family)